MIESYRRKAPTYKVATVQGIKDDSGLFYVLGNQVEIAKLIDSTGLGDNWSWNMRYGYVDILHKSRRITANIGDKIILDTTTNTLDSMKPDQFRKVFEKVV